MATKNVQKLKPRPKRPIVNPGDDHELGLWIDYELLRKHQNRSPEMVIHDPISSLGHLELADLALGKKNKKSKSTAAGETAS